MFQYVTSQLSQYGKTSLNFNEARNDRVWGWLWHQLDHVQTICTSLQTDNHTNTSSLNLVIELIIQNVETELCCWWMDGWIVGQLLLIQLHIKHELLKCRDSYNTGA